MYHWQKIDRHFLVLLSSACLVLSPSLNAKAQQMTIAEQPHTNTPVNDNNPVSGAAFLSIGRPTDR